MIAYRWCGDSFLGVNDHDLATVIRALASVEVRRALEALGPPRPKRGFSREEAADYCGVSTYKVAAAIRQNWLPAVRNGKAVILLREDLEMWMDTWETH